MSADSAIMHPGSKVLALRAVAQDPATNQTVTNLQVYNLETKAKVKACVMTDQIVFWKWVSNKTIGIVTAASVFHWDMDGDPAAAPVKVFDRAPNLAGTQIISYRLDPTGKWSTVIGIAPGPAEKPQLIQGKMQLYSFERQQSQPLDAHCAAFSQVKLQASKGGRAHPGCCCQRRFRAVAGQGVVLASDRGPYSFLFFFST